MNNFLPLYIAAANAALYTPIDTGGAMDPGIVCAANAERFNETYQSVPLTNYAQGWKDTSNIDGQLEFLAPDCPVEDRFNYREFINSEEFLVDLDNKDIRALGSDFAKVEYTGEERHDQVANKGLMTIVETRDLEKNTSKRFQIVDRLIRRIKRNELVRAHALHVASSVSTALTWGASSDPDMDMQDAKGASADISGIHPNRIFIGETAWAKRVRAYRSQNNAGGFASAAMSKDELGGLLGAQVEKGESRYQVTTTTKAQIGGNVVLLYYAEPGLSKEDPSTVKRFTALCDDGSKIRVFEQQLGSKLTAITVEHYSSVRITSTLGKRALIIS